MRALIVDDEPLARQRLRQMLVDVSDMEIAGEARNGFEAVAMIEDLRPDLVFLDIQMPELDGFGVIEAIGPDRMPPTLFVTAFDTHAVRAFEVNALDYLLKPFEPERLQKALERVRAQRALSRPVQAPLEAMLAEIQQGKGPADRFLVKSGDRWVLVKASAIQWIEAESNYVRLHVEGGSHLLRHTMTGILGRLDGRLFKRIHRSAIVNLDCIRELQPWSGGDLLVLMKDGSRLTLSRTYREAFGEWL